MKRKIFLITILLLVVLTYLISLTRIRTGSSCCEEPIVRWKFAIYLGECDDETGCHFIKMEETGILEYFGLKKFSCPCSNKK